MIQFGPDLDVETRFNHIKPAIDTIQLLQLPSEDPRLEKWYSTQWADYGYAMTAIQHAMDKYPADDHAYLSEAHTVGLQSQRAWQRIESESVQSSME